MQARIEQYEKKRRKRRKKKQEKQNKQGGKKINNASLQCNFSTPVGKKRVPIQRRHIEAAIPDIQTLKSQNHPDHQLE